MSTTAQVPDPEVPAKPRSRTYTAAYKSRILAEYDGLGKAAKCLRNNYCPLFGRVAMIGVARAS
jgi:hypothetical protein